MFIKLINITVLSTLFFVRASLAADCPPGEFCVWTNENFEGQRTNWSGDDGWWEDPIAGNDNSWANHGISGPGVKDHVLIYAEPNWVGKPVLCLAPGQEVAINIGASKKGASHKWAMSC